MSQSTNHLKHDREFTGLKQPPQSPNLNLTEHLLDVVKEEICMMDVQLRSVLHISDAS